MTIEVRQMIVKTSVVHRSRQESNLVHSNQNPTPSPDMRYLLEQCRRMLSEMLQEKRER